MNNLEQITEQVREGMEVTHAAREIALRRSRELIRICAKAIRAVHREEWASAESQLKTAQEAANQLREGVKGHTNLYYAGYTQDSLKEYVEARLTYALIRNQTLPTPQELETENNTWLNGLAEAATELRRRILDIIRHGHSTEAERLLDKMDEIYSILVTFDFSDSITGGLRRRTDTVRAVLERTRGDVTNSLRQTQLQSALHKLEVELQKSNQSLEDTTMATVTVGDKTFEVAKGTRLVKAIEDNGIDILHRCGGFARCTTCKVTFNSGEPEAYRAAEKAKLEDKGDLGDYRLSCQILCESDMDVNVLMTMTSSGLDDAGPDITDEIADGD